MLLTTTKGVQGLRLALIDAMAQLATDPQMVKDVAAHMARSQTVAPAPPETEPWPGGAATLTRPAYPTQGDGTCVFTHITGTGLQITASGAQKALRWAAVAHGGAFGELFLTASAAIPGLTFLG